MTTTTLNNPSKSSNAARGFEFTRQGPQFGSNKIIIDNITTCWNKTLSHYPSIVNDLNKNRLYKSNYIVKRKYNRGDFAQSDDFSRKSNKKLQELKKFRCKEIAKAANLQDKQNKKTETIYKNKLRDIKINKLQIQSGNETTLMSLLISRFAEVGELKERLSISELDNLVNLGKFNEMESIVNHFEKFIYLLLSLHSSSSCSGIIATIMLYLKTYNNKALLSFDNITNLKDLIQDICESFKDHYNNQVRPQGFEDFDWTKFDFVHVLLDDFENIQESKFFPKVEKLFYYLISLNLFSKLGIDLSMFGLNTFDEHKIRNKNKIKSLSFLSWLISSLRWVCTSGYNLVMTGNVGTFCFDNEQVSAWFDMYEDVVLQNKHITHLEALDCTYHEFILNLKTLLSKGKNMEYYFKKLSKDSKQLSYFQKCMFNLKDIQNNVLSVQAANKTRRSPFMFLAIGSSSVMKSTLNQILATYLAKVTERPSGEQYIYSMNAYDDFMSGYQCSMHTLIIDEILAIRDTRITEDDKSVKRLLQIANNVPYVTEQAALEDKGTTPMRAEIVLSTTNNSMHSISTYYNNPYAVMRRFNVIIELSVKEEFVNSSGGVDKSKLPPSGEIPNIWNFTIYRVESIVDNVSRSTHQQFRREIDTSVGVNGCFADIKDFLLYMKSQINLHDSYQTSAMEYNASFLSMDVCSVCGLINDCACMKLQGGLTTIVSLFKRHLKTPHGRKVILNELDYQLKSKAVSLLGFEMNLDENVEEEEIYEDCRSGFNRCLDNVEDLVLYCHDQCSKHKFILSGVLATLSIVSGLLVARNFFLNKSKKSTIIPPQGTSLSVMSYGERPNPNVIERDNVWHQKDIELSKFDFSHQSRCTDTTLLRKIVAKNTIMLLIDDDEPGKVIPCRGVGLGGHLFVFNNHTIPTGKTLTCTVIISRVYEGVSSNIENIKIDQAQIFREPRGDVCYFMINQIPPIKNIINYFTEDVVKGNFSGDIIIREIDGTVSFTEVHNLNYSIEDYSRHNKNFVHFQEVYAGKTLKPTSNGHCGSPYIAECGLGKFIMGIHVAGGMVEGESRVNCLIITQRMINRAREHFKTFLVDTNAPVIDAPSKTFKLGELHQKSTVRFLEKGHANVYGTLEGTRKHGKSGVTTTYIEPFAIKHGYIRQGAKPVLAGWEPYHLAAKEMVNTVTTFEQSKIDICVNEFYKDIIEKIPVADLVTCKPYDVFTAINGIDGVAYVDSIKWKTSMGHPYNTCKKVYKVDCSDTGKFTFTDEVLDRIDYVHQVYLAGKRYMPIYGSSTKDEVVTPEKAANKATRIFSPSPVDWNIVCRMYLLPAIRLIQNYKLAFETAVGTVAQSEEWDTLYKSITKYGIDRIVAGDFKKYDKRMPPALILAAFALLRRICAAAGWTEQQLNVISCIGEDVAFPLINLDGDLIEFFGTNPSGHPLTVIINSLVNSLYTRYVYLELNPKKECHSFQKNVSLLSYGDDNIYSVSKNIDWFNHCTIQDKYAELGITYTMADKSSESVPFINIADASFLKRKWRFDEDLQKFLAPLDHDSINKSLTMCVRSKVETPQKQSVDTLTGACREYFWYGKEEFNKRREILMQIADEAKLDFYMHENVFPTWEELAEDFKAKSYDVARFEKYQNKKL